MAGTVSTDLTLKNVEWSAHSPPLLTTPEASSGGELHTPFLDWPPVFIIEGHVQFRTSEDVTSFPNQVHRPDEFYSCIPGRIYL